MLSREAMEFVLQRSYHGSDILNYIKELEQYKTIVENSCWNCKHNGWDDEKEPCSRCKNLHNVSHNELNLFELDDKYKGAMEDECK